MRNITAGNLSEAIVLKFVVIKAVTGATGSGNFI
jgi:hypothetical protein